MVYRLNLACPCGLLSAGLPSDVFLSITPGSNCEYLPCEANNPCENGAVCVEELDQDHFPLGFRCHCRQGFTGPRCEINVDECSSSPCFHGFCYDGKKTAYLANMLNNRHQKQTSKYTQTLCQLRFCSLTIWQAIFNWVTIAANKSVMRVELFHLMRGPWTLPAGASLISSPMQL